MRRADWVAIALVGAVASGVLSLIVTAPRPHARPIAAASDATSTPPDSTAADAHDSSVTVALTAPRAGDAVRGREVRSRNPAPVRDLEEIQRHLRLGAPGTYIDDIIGEQDAELVRWPESTVFRVWIAPTTTATDWRPEYADSVRAAFSAWTAAGAPISAQFTSDSADANVRIHWIDRFTEGGTIGQTLQTWDQYRWLVAGDITIATHATTGQALGPSWITATALHEIGHLFGLNHSKSNGDIMATEAHALVLSRADLATLRLLYALPPGAVR